MKATKRNTGTVRPHIGKLCVKPKFLIAPLLLQYLTFIGGCLISETPYCQSLKDKEINIDQFIQSLFSQPSDDLNYEDLYEVLYQYYTTPLELNTASREEVESLHLLSISQIDHFFSHLHQYGPLLSIYELQAIPEFDIPIIHSLLPFVTIVPKSKSVSPQGIYRSAIGEGNTYFMFRAERIIEKKKGYETGKYLGSPEKFYGRFRSNHTKDYSLGFTMEKDAGEKIMWNNHTHTFGPDFFSYHFCLYNRGRIKAAVAGDYLLQFGQGLLLGAGLRFGKSAEPVTSVKRNNLGIRPYTSALEEGFFRGGAVTWKLHDKAELTGFYSGKRIDGNLQNADTTENEKYITGIQYSGYHRTESELENKSVVKEKIYGGNFSIMLFKQKFHLGLTAIHTAYGKLLQKTPQPYNLYEFRGMNNTVAGIDFNFLLKNFNIFGEYGASASRGTGMLTGLIASITSYLELALLMRKYDRNFHSFYGNAFGENSRNINETGIFWGLKIHPFQRWKLTSFYDRFFFPWLRYQADGPSEGEDAQVRISYTPTKKTVLYGQYHLQKRDKNIKNDFVMNALMPATKKNFLLHLEYLSNEKLSFQTRIQFTTYKHMNQTTYGYYIMQELSWSYLWIKAGTRFALFDTDDYNNRQYTYEKNVFSAFSIPQLSGRGTRFYILAQFKISKKTDIWLRYSRTTYYNVTSTGSYNEEISGNKNTTVTFQIRYKL
jgi:hypothetical protein